MADKLKALTVVNIPFVEDRFQPGEMISSSVFTESEKAAKAALGPDAEVISAKEQIADLIKNGSLSEDADAELHPDHRPVSPNAVTLAGVVEQARMLVEAFEERGERVPAELQKMADLSAVSTEDRGKGGDKT